MNKPATPREALDAYLTGQESILRALIVISPVGMDGSDSKDALAPYAHLAFIQEFVMEAIHVGEGAPQKVVEEFEALKDEPLALGRVFIDAYTKACALEN